MCSFHGERCIYAPKDVIAPERTVLNEYALEMMKTVLSADIPLFLN
ncbi:hypothetical protein [Domibacillus mangrovi]|nr:hypothetical protein [Domibacillus mangrovi]